MTGSDWPLLTGSSRTLDRLWSYFSIYHQKVAESTPAGVDWQTGQPYTYDVDHSDGFVLLDQHQHERFIAGGMVQIPTVPERLRKLLDREGRSNLSDPGGGSWTVTDGLGSIGWLLGHKVDET
jgi:cytochrome oxidase Cu insertion factor (SCO1/SenC/PrrC family)